MTTQPSAKSPARIYRDDSDTSAINQQLIIFSLGTLPFKTEYYLLGMQLFYVQEILNIPPIMRVPHSPFFVWGMTYWRKQLVPVVDMGVRLGIDPTILEERSRLIIIRTRTQANQERQLVGLLAHHVVRITPPTEEMNPGPHPTIDGLRTDLLRVTLTFDGKPLLIPDLVRGLDPVEADR